MRRTTPSAPCRARDGLVWLSAPHVASNAAAFDAGDREEALQLAIEGTEHSPMPAGEWSSLRAALGDDLLAELLHVSPSSLRRYTTGERATPEAVAARLHALAPTVADLAGAYNDFGIRRWFRRPRGALAGVTPADVLADEWDPEGPQITRVRELAANLVARGAS